MSENVFGDQWDAEQDEPGFRWKRMRLGRRLGAEILGASVYELPTGQRSFPYHFHYANEELLIVLHGKVSVRVPDGEQFVGPGEAVVFRRGAEGAHQVINRSEAPARFMVISTMVKPEVAEYPDTNKLGIFTGSPPGAAARSVLWLRKEPTVDYFEGEPTDESAGA